MSSTIFRWSVPLIASAIALNSTSASQPLGSADQIRLGFAYFEPPRSIGTPLEDVARSYSGYGLASRIEGRLRLDTDPALTEWTRDLIRRQLAEGS
jgi:hypothetical protein